MGVQIIRESECPMMWLCPMLLTRLLWHHECHSVKITLPSHPLGAFPNSQNLAKIPQNRHACGQNSLTCWNCPPSPPCSCFASSPGWGMGCWCVFHKACLECQLRGAIVMSCFVSDGPACHTPFPLHPVANGFRSKGCETSWVQLTHHFSSDPGFFDLSAHLVSCAPCRRNGSWDQKGFEASFVFTRVCLSVGC